MMNAKQKGRAIVGVQIGITSGCAVYRNGIIEFAASEERFSNIKNDTSFPEQAIQAAQRFCGLTADDIEHVVLVSQRMSPDHFLVSRECTFSIQDYLHEQEAYYRPRLMEGKSLDYLEVFKHKLDPRYTDLYERVKGSTGNRVDIWNDWRTKKVSQLLSVPAERVSIVHHESAHAAYAYYGSPFRGEDVLAVTFDGFGDQANASVSVIENGKLKPVQNYQNFNIGRIYRYITLLLAMKPNEHEYKVMGLAPYATEYTYKRALNVFLKAYQFIDGTVHVDKELKDHFYYFKDRLEGCRFDGIAAALQLFTERMNCGLVDHWMRTLGKRRVVLSGGVALNIKANMEIGKLASVEDLFVPGSGGDESLCIAGIYTYLDQQDRGSEIQPLHSLYLGGDIDRENIDTEIHKVRARTPAVVREGMTPQAVAQLLKDGNVIGRVSGRMEFGARALGNRSILADPSTPEVVRKINAQIKNRDFWMPFTPSMLPEAAEQYLINPKKFAYPYMSVASETTDLAKRHLPGALHPADFTARPHVVEERINPDYHALLGAFQKATGTGALLNTSLNLHGYPIVRSAAQALHVFENSHLDAMVLGTTLVARPHVLKLSKVA